MKKIPIYVCLLLVFAMAFSAPLEAAALNPDLDNRITESQNYWRWSGANFYGEARPLHPSQATSPEMWLQIILDRLIYVSPLRGYDIRSQVVNDGTLNAKTDGRTIYVHAGLLQLIGQREDLVASVLAHELGHIIAHHKIGGGQSFSKSILQLAAPFASQVKFGNYAMLGLSELTNMKGSSYSRFQEKEADAIAAVIAEEAGYSAYGLNEFFDVVSENSRASLMPSSLTIPTQVTNKSQVIGSVALNLLRVSPLYKSHPPSTQRKQVVELITETKAGNQSLGALEKKDSWLAGVLTTLERRRPKNK